MGRPINKRYFGVNANNNLKVQFNGGSGSLPGYIIKQKGSTRFLCSNAGGTVTAVCNLVAKASASLANGEMSITVKLDDATVGQITQISAHRVTLAGVSYPWSFSSSTSDGAAQVEEAGSAIGAGADATLGTSDDVLTGASDLEGDG
jgi:hypothetical protein